MYNPSLKRKRRRPTIGLEGGCAPGITCFPVKTGKLRIGLDACHMEWIPVESCMRLPGVRNLPAFLQIFVFS